VVIEARNQSGNNLMGASGAQDIPDFRFPDNNVYEAADRICEEIARKQAICSDETVLKCVDGAMRDSNAGHIATDETKARLVNKVDFSIKRGVALSSQDDAFVHRMDLANCKQPLQLSELQYCNVLMKTECGVKTAMFKRQWSSDIAYSERSH